MILADPLAGIADEPQPPRGKVVQPAKPVEQLARFWIGVERVDGEIAPRRIVLPVAGKGHRCAATVGRDVAAQRGDLDRPAGQDGSNRAVLDPGRHHLDRMGLQPPHHFLRLERGGDVDVLHRQPQQGVAHRPADIAGLARAKRPHQHAQVIALQPVGRRQAPHHAILLARLLMIPAVTPQMRCSCHMISM